MTVDTLTSAGPVAVIAGTRALRLPEQSRPAARPAATPRIAAVRLSSQTFPGVVAGLHQAGLGVLDINAHPVGPRPQLIVLELPDDPKDAGRLVRGSGHGPGRLFVTRDADHLPLASDVSGCDEIVLVPCSPLQIAAAALRVSRVAEHLLLEWARQVFDGSRADGVLARG